MENNIERSTNGGTMTINNFNQSTWSNTPNSTVDNTNTTLLFIAVEYVKSNNDFKYIPEASFPTQETSACTDFEHVSPLDPNMGSTACYSPSSPPCNDANNPYNPVVQQLITEHTVPLINNNNNNSNNTNDSAYMRNLAEPDASLDSLQTLSNAGANLLKQVATNRYLLNQQRNTVTNISNSSVLELVPENNTEQEVELLITDQVTVFKLFNFPQPGISYNVNAQEYLVERCLADEQQLLEALTPGPLLDTDLLALDDSTLKSQLPDLAEPPTSNNGTVSSRLPITIKVEDCKDDIDRVYTAEKLRRSQRQLELRSNETKEDLLNQVHTISDKPVESRARATLPIAYLSIIKHSEGGYGVYARKMIPKRTQFGPLEGILVVNNHDTNDCNLQFLIECENGSVHRLDVSDENVANWMCFVRKANTYAEQNLLLFQQGDSLYYTTTENIWPKQELLVGYSTTYASKHNLPLLPMPLIEDNDWPCFECDEHFPSSDELQKHLNIHDDNINGNFKLKKKAFKSKRKRLKKLYENLILECKLCTAVFSYPEYNVLRRHLLAHGVGSCLAFEEKFTIVKYTCEKCYVTFESEAVLKIHKLLHKVDSDQETVSLKCPDCLNEFINQKELIEHVNQHRSNTVVPQPKSGCKCPVCYKIFASLDRIQRHMLVHGSEESKPLKCDTCNKRFLNNSALACHLKTHSTDKKIFECPMCKESFKCVLQLKIHVQQHCIDGTYTCPHCKKVFKEYSIIRKHIRAFHCDRKHNCPDCSKSFPTLDKLRMHLLRHSDHREFLCADCGKQFKRKDKLKEHTKRMHSEERENAVPKPTKITIQSNKKFTPKVEPTDYHRFIYKCHACLVGFKRRGMLVNHLAKRHPDISPDSVPELNLPILRTTRDYYCQYCDKVYKSSSKRKAHILKNHPGQALPMSNRRQGSFPDVGGLPNPTFSQTVGSVTTRPQACQWCHKQYASKAKLLQHQRKKHSDLVSTRSSQIKSSGHQNQVIPNQEVEEIVIDTHSFKRDFKVSDEELLSEVVALNAVREDDQYYHIISVPHGDNLDYDHSSELNHSADSQLYRLLTTGNGLLPPR